VLRHISWFLFLSRYSLSGLEAVGSLGSTGAQSALRGVGAGTAEQQRLQLEAAASAPRAVGRKQVVDFLSHAGAAETESAPREMKREIMFMVCTACSQTI